MAKVKMKKKETMETAPASKQKKVMAQARAEQERISKQSHESAMYYMKKKP